MGLTLDFVIHYHCLILSRIQFELLTIIVIDIHPFFGRWGIRILQLTNYRLIIFRMIHLHIVHPIHRLNNIRNFFLDEKLSGFLSCFDIDALLLYSIENPLSSRVSVSMKSSFYTEIWFSCSQNKKKFWTRLTTEMIMIIIRRDKLNSLNECLLSFSIGFSLDMIHNQFNWLIFEVKCHWVEIEHLCKGTSSIFVQSISDCLLFCIFTYPYTLGASEDRNSWRICSRSASVWPIYGISAYNHHMSTKNNETRTKGDRARTQV